MNSLEVFPMKAKNTEASAPRNKVVYRYFGLVHGLIYIKRVFNVISFRYCSEMFLKKKVKKVLIHHKCSFEIHLLSFFPLKRFEQ